MFLEGARSYEGERRLIWELSSYADAWSQVGIVPGSAAQTRPLGTADSSLAARDWLKRALIGCIG